MSSMLGKWLLSGPSAATGCAGQPNTRATTQTIAAPVRRSQLVVNMLHSLGLDAQTLPQVTITQLPTYPITKFRLGPGARGLRAPGVGSSIRQDFVRRLEGDAGRFRDRSRQRVQER